MEHTDIPLDRSRRIEYEFHESPFRQQRFTLLLAVLTAICMSFTAFFAYNSSLEHPISSKLIFENPERSILVLNIASQVTIFCLAELTSSVLEATRWAFACTCSGVAAYTFLALSRATSSRWSAMSYPGKRCKSRDSSTRWPYVVGRPKVRPNAARCLFRGCSSLLIRGAAGYPPSVGCFLQVNISCSVSVSDREGRAYALNTSLVDVIGFNLTATAEFWFFFPAFLSDSKRVKNVAPIDCPPGEMCTSFFVPGSMNTILLDPSQPSISQDSYPKAISYIQNDAPGYQIEFRPIDT